MTHTSSINFYGSDAFQSSVFKQQCLQDGLVHYSSKKINVDNVEDFLDDIVKAYPGIAITNLTSYTGIAIGFATDLRITYCAESNYFSVFTNKGFAFIKKLYEDLGCVDCKSLDEIAVTYYYIGSGLEYTSINLDKSKIPPIYNDLYPDINIDLLIKEFSESRDTLLLSYGEPGTGKTTLIKYFLLSALYKNIAYAKDVKTVTSSEFWPMMSESYHDLIIFDDLDFSLGARHEGDNGFVSNLLSYSDGVLQTDSKVFITTNLPIIEIDQALLRDGRCFDFIHLRPMEKEYARTLWVDKFNIDIAEFDNIYEKNDDVTQACFMRNVESFIEDSKRYTYYNDPAMASLSLQDRIEKAGMSTSKKREIIL